MDNEPFALTDSDAIEIYVTRLTPRFVVVHGKPEALDLFEKCLRQSATAIANVKLKENQHERIRRSSASLSEE